ELHPPPDVSGLSSAGMRDVDSSACVTSVWSAWQHRGRLSKRLPLAAGEWLRVSVMCFSATSRPLPRRARLGTQRDGGVTLEDTSAAAPPWDEAVPPITNLAHLQGRTFHCRKQTNMDVTNYEKVVVAPMSLHSVIGIIGKLDGERPAQLQSPPGAQQGGPSTLLRETYLTWVGDRCEVVNARRVMVLRLQKL
ncbi:unnamed protein product, partial [Pleuronectes platessa]